MIDAKGDPAVRDAALIAAAQRVEHYEMAGYGESGRSPSNWASAMSPRLSSKPSTKRARPTNASRNWRKIASIPRRRCTHNAIARSQELIATKNRSTSRRLGGVTFLSDLTPTLAAPRTNSVPS